MPKKIEKSSSPEDEFNSYMNKIDKEFSSCLEEIKKVFPSSFSKKILGLNSRQYSIMRAFQIILEQENLVEECQGFCPSYMVLKKEKARLKQMIKDIKLILKKDYQSYYDYMKEIS